MRKFVLPIAASLLFGSASIMAQAATQKTMDPPVTNLPVTRSNHAALSESDIKHSVAEAGYKVVKGLEFKDGVWRTEARGGDDNWVDLLIAPVTGKVYEADAPSQLNADEIRAKLSAAGFEKIDDVEFEDGLWSADASNAKGARLKLLVDPDDGSVVASQRR